MARISSADFPTMLLDDMAGNPALGQALGDMLVAWSAAERALVITLQFLTHTKRSAAVAMYFRIPTFESRIKVIRALAADWTQPKIPKESFIQELDVQALAKMVDKLSKLSLTRNGWVHGSWTFNPRDKTISVINYREPLDSEKRRTPIKANDIKVHVTAVKEWIRKLRGELDLLEAMSFEIEKPRSKSP
jgi:hypothetical protein